MQLTHDDDLTDVRTGPLPTDPVATFGQLKAMMLEAEESGIYEGDPFADIRARMGWKPKV